MPGPRRAPAYVNLPNGLTLLRLVVIPPLVLLMLSGTPRTDAVAAVIFLLASFSDTLDGRLARRWGQVTELGKFLDPLADKLFILAVLLVLVNSGLMPAWVVLVIFGRELLITILRSVSAAQGRVIAASRLGKTKTVLQVAAVFISIVQRPEPVLAGAAFWITMAAVVVTLYSGLDYLWRFRHVFTRQPAALVVVPVATVGGASGEVAPVSAAVSRLAGQLTGRQITIGTVESCTGGLVARLITDLPGSSAFFVGGLVTYSNRLKVSLAGVDEQVLAGHGAVSEAVARQMAGGGRSRLGADYVVSVTGIAGPAGGGPDKPVGLTFIAVAGPERIEVFRHLFAGDRWTNRQAAADAALRHLADAVGSGLD